MDVTYNFTAGTRAVAQQVNTNFADVKSAVDPLETDVANIKTQLTSGIILPDGSIDFTRLQSYKTYTVSNATNATPIVVTAVAHSFLTGDKVFISGVGGNTAANGTFTVTKIGADTFSLDSSVGNGAFTTNGTAVIYPSADDNLVNKVYVDNTNIMPKGTCTTASATAAKTVTIGSGTSTDGLTIEITFTNANTTTAPTLNYNNEGAFNIASEDGIVCSATNPFYVPAGVTVEFTKKSSYWVYKNRVVANYVNGTSWYRVWSDGWIEQGGLFIGNLGTVTLLKAYSNTSYSVYATVYNGNGAISSCVTSTSVINVSSQIYNNTSLAWLTKGY